MVFFIKGHGEVAQRVIGPPARHDGQPCAVDYVQLVRAGKVDEQERSVGLKLKRFGMDTELDVCHFVAVLIEDCDAAASVSDQDAMRGRIVANIVSVTAQVDFAQKPIVTGVEDADCAVSPVVYP